MAVELPVLPSGSHFTETETGTGTGLIRQFDWRHRKPNVIITNWGRKVFFRFPKKEIFACYGIRHQKAWVSKTLENELFIQLSENFRNKTREFVVIFLSVCSRVWLSFLLSAAGENNEGGVQVPRREWILRAQDLLALPRFISPGE